MKIERKSWCITIGPIPKETKVMSRADQGYSDILIYKADINTDLL